MYDSGYHVVWCSKYRPAALIGPVEDRCEALIRAKAAAHRWHPAVLEIVPDHGHLFVQAHPRDSPSHIAKL